MTSPFPSALAFHPSAFRSKVALCAVAASLAAGCGDDDGSPSSPPGPDAGDAGESLSTSGTDETVGTTSGSSTSVGNETSETQDSSEASTTDLDSGVDDSSDPSSDGETSETTQGDTSTVDDDAGISSDDAGTGATTNESTDSASTSEVPSSDAGAETSGEPLPDWVGLEVGQAAPTFVAVEPLGNEGYLGVVFDAQGNFYAVGSATTPTGDSYMAVTKFLPSGAVDTNFGENGVARKNVVVGGAESVRAITLQTSGEPATQYIVIAGTAQFEPEAEGLAANEVDTVLVRFTMSGEVNESFGDAGVVHFNLNTGVEGLDRMNNPAWVANETVWSLGTTMGDRLVVHGEARSDASVDLEDGGVAERTDVDWVLVRLLADGSFDTSFSDDGKVTLDLDGAGASARSATVLADGSIIGSGYLTSEVLGQNTQQPVLYKVTPTGEFDATFATQDAWNADGVFHDTVVAPPLRAEAYGAALQGNHLVTMGYGPTTGTGTGSDFIALRFTADGAFDTTFGTNGVTYVDAAGQSDNGRSLVVLPDQTILGIGGGRRLLDDQVTTVSDGMLVLLTPDGAPMQSFGEGGLRLYDMGGTSDFFWAGAVSPDESKVVIVGIKGASGTGDDADTDGAVLVLPLTALAN